LNQGLMKIYTNLVIIRNNHFVHAIG
jgi:hypothetical protein